MTQPVETWRVFMAAELPGNIRERIIKHINRLRSEFPDVRASWIRAENLHLTLKFLGNIPVGRIPALSAATDVAARTAKPFDVIIAGCGSFPPRGRPNVLWIGIEDSPQAPPRAQASCLHDLQRALEDECARAGFEREPRPYHPHLTIARLRNKAGSHSLAELHREMGFTSEPVTVSELVVFRSELRSEGSKHTAISRHQLG